MLFFASISDPLTADEQALLDLCARIPAFKSAIESYKSGSLTPNF